VNHHGHVLRGGGPPREEAPALGEEEDLGVHKEVELHHAHVDAGAGVIAVREQKGFAVEDLARKNMCVDK